MATNGSVGPPFFIVGAARSGTTLLKTMFDRHPYVAIPSESHFITPLWKRRRRYGREGYLDNREAFLHDLAGDWLFRLWDIPIDEVRDRLEPFERPHFSDGVAAAFRAYADSMGKPRWGDKTPRYVEHVTLLADLFPEARFIHMIRDGRDVALSILGIKRMHTHAASAAHYWNRHTHSGRRAGSRLGRERYAEVRYEDLIDDPGAELARLCAFLDLPMDPALLEHDETAVERLPGFFRDMHKRLALPPTKGVRDWRRDLDPAELADFEAIAGDGLLEAGYELATTPRRLTAIRARARVVAFWLRTFGSRVGMRVKRRRARREWARRPVMDGRHV